MVIPGAVAAVVPAELVEASPMEVVCKFDIGKGAGDSGLEAAEVDGPDLGNAEGTVFFHQHSELIQ